MTIIEFYAKENQMTIDQANEDFIDLVLTALHDDVTHNTHGENRHCHRCELEKLIQDYENGCYEFKDYKKMLVEVKQFNWKEKEKGLWTCGNFAIKERDRAGDICYQLMYKGFHLGYYRGRHTASSAAHKMIKNIASQIGINS